MVTRKTEADTIDGTPEKRLFLSIISDYDLKTGLCELIDNALDIWKSAGSTAKLNVAVTLDVDRQMICVKDDAGGIKRGNLRLLVAPGATGNKPGIELIGIFGVGGKRAGVALGELVEIKTRHKQEKSLQVDITNEWLNSDDWDLASYEIPNIDPNTTSVEISKLRQKIEDGDVDQIRTHLGETYSWYIKKGCKISLNGKPITPIEFEKWSFPKGFEPRRAKFEINPMGDKKLDVTVVGGLIGDRVAEKENYGVYIYCNNRLIVKELRVREVGYFVSSEAGVPHPDASLCRVILHINGAPDAMPWNSSKSGINYSHTAFIQIRKTLIGLVSYYSSLSRRTKSDWDGTVFPFTEGKIQDISPDDLAPGKKMTLPDLPRVRKLPPAQALKESNSKVLKDKPWTLGLIEAMGLVDLLSKQNLETKNRAALILLDSNFEIAMKEFIVNRPDLYPPHIYKDQKIAHIFTHRSEVIKEITAKVALDPTLLGKVNHFYALRNKLTHERATVGITDNQIKDYKSVVQTVLKKLFNLKFPSI